MTAILLGSNEIRDCGNFVSLDGKSLFDFEVVDDQVIITFQVTLPATKAEIRVDNNEVAAGDGIHVDRESRVVTVRQYDNRLIRIDANYEPARVELDLRSLGLQVYTDDQALHVAGATLAGNRISNCGGGIAIS